MRRAALVALVLAAVLAFAGAAATEAHSNLTRSEPAANSVVPTSPARIVMEFSEPPDLKFSSWILYDGTGGKLAEGAFQSLDGSGTTLFIAPPPLANGTWTVAYRVLSAVDGHVISSTLSFSVGAPTSGAVAPQVDALATGGPPKALSLFSRWLTFISVAMVAGLVLFVPLILIPVIRSQEGDAVAVDGLQRRISRLFVLILAVLATGAVLALIMQAWRSAGTFSGGLDALGNILGDSRFGHTWIARGVLIGLLAEVALVSRSGLSLSNGSRRTWFVLGVVALAIPVTVSLNSHAAAGADLTVLATVADWFHLVGSGAWIGGLLLLVLVLSAIAGLDNGTKVRFLAAMVPRFSVLAIVAVSVIVVTGIFQWALRIGNLDDTFSSGYGQGIIAKTLLLAPMLALGAANLLVVSPRLRSIAAGLSGSVSSVIPRFRGSIALEICFGMSILLATAFVTDTSPPVGQASAAPGIRQERQIDDLDIQLGVLPGSAGQNETEITLRDTRGAKEPVSQVIVQFTYKDADLGVTEEIATPTVTDRYAVTGLQFSLPGSWEILLIVQREGVSDATAAFTIEIPPA